MLDAWGTDEGIQVARPLHVTHPEISGGVVVSQFVDPSYVLGLPELGSARRAYLLKERVSDPEQLVAAMEAVVDGGSVIDPEVVEVLVRVRTAGARSPLAELTPRERDVPQSLLRGSAILRSRSRSYSPSARSRTTSTRSSPSSS